MADIWGLTDDGFYRPSFEECLKRRQALYRADVDPDLDLGSETVLGQLLGVDCRSEALVWENQESLYHGNDPDAAEGILLENVSKITGTSKQGARASTVKVLCSLVSSTILEAGIHFVAVDGNEDVRFTPAEDFEAPTTGDHLVVFVSEDLGPIQAEADTLTVIATPVVGWSAATNPSDAIPGALENTDEELRLRRDDELSAAGGSTLAALRQAVRDVSPLIQSVSSLANKTAFVDSNGLPPNSYEIIVYDAGAVSDDEIAQAIYDIGPGGIQPFGTDSGLAVDPETGESVEVAFSRATEVEVYIEASFTTGAGYIGDTQAKVRWASELNTLFVVGGTVIALEAKATPLDFEGVIDVPTFFLGLAASPSGTENLIMTVRQIPRFSSSRIDLA